MKKIKKISALLLASATVLSCFSCGAADNSHSDFTVNVFAAPVTEKILRESDYSAYYGSEAKISVVGARNEYESAQIIFNAEEDVKNYTLITNDLYCGDDKLSKENVEVYAQKYVNIDRYSLGTAIDTEKYPLGNYPDPLLPVAVSEEYGENNAKANENQGIWFSFYFPEELPAGVYRGEFVLITDGIETTIPVEAKIKDFTLGKEQHLKTIFTTTQEWLMQGELDNTDEMYERYTEQLLEYRISCFDVPYADNLEKYIEYIKKVTADERFSAFGFYTEVTQVDKTDFPLRPDGTSYGIENSDIDYRLLMFDENTLREYVAAMIENSTPELNLFKKATLYYGSLDEAHASRMQENCKWLSMRMTDCLIVIADEYGDEGLARYGLKKSDVIGLDMLFTIPYFSECEGIRGFCPLINEFGTEDEREKYADAAGNTYAGYNGEAEGFSNQWWYFCNNPSEPYPNYHIDGSLMGGRILGWMSYDYKMDGLLTWGTACYLDFSNQGAGNKRGFNTPRPAYDEMQTGALANGDGFLVYPGKKYGLNGFIPSVRLMTLRDGFEDYEYLYALGEGSEKYADKYAAKNYDAGSAISETSDLLYNGLIAKADYETFLSVREKICDELELIEGPAHALIESGKRDAVNEKREITVYAALGTSCTIDGKEISGTPSGEGLKFVYDAPLNKRKNEAEITLTNGDYSVTIIKDVGGRIVVAEDFKKGISDWYTIDYDDYKPVSLSYENGSLKADCAKNESGSLFYVPGFAVSYEKLFGDFALSEINTLIADMVNLTDGEVSVTVSVEFTNGKRTVSRTVKTIVLSVGNNEINVSGFENAVPSASDYRPSAIIFGFENSDKNAVSILLSNIRLVLGE